MADRVPAEWHHKIMHIQMKTADGFTLMGSDAPPAYYNKPQGFSVSLQMMDPAEAERIYAALMRGGRGEHGTAEDLLGGALRHADRPLRHPLDHQLHRGGLTAAPFTQPPAGDRGELQRSAGGRDRP